MALSDLRGKVRAPKAAPEPPSTTDEDDLAALEAKLAAAKAAKAKVAKATPPEPDPQDDVIEAEAYATDDAETDTAEAAADAPSLGALATLPDLGALVKAAGASGALSAFVDETESSGFKPLFPAVFVRGGDGGGNFDVSSSLAEEVSDRMPIGRKPIKGFLLGYRVSVAAWKIDYEQRADEDTPAFSVSVPSTAADEVRLIAKATKNYMFTKKADKDAFDWNNGEGCGRPVPTLEVLIWHPTAGIMVVKTQSHHNAVARSLRALAKGPCDEAGTVIPQPVTIDVVQTKESSDSNSWSIYHLTFAPLLTGGKEIVDGFRAAMQDVDDATQADFSDWVSCADQPMTDLAREKLTLAARL